METTAAPPSERSGTTFAIAVSQYEGGGVISRLHKRVISLFEKFAVRVIPRKGKSEYVTQLLTKLKWLTAKNRLNLDTACFMYRVAHGQDPTNICEPFPRVHGKSQRSRQSDDFYTPQTKSPAGKQSLHTGAPSFGTAWHLHWTSALTWEAFTGSTNSICLLNSNN